MASEDPNTWFGIKDVIIAASGVVVTLGGWVARMQVKRIDDAEEKIDRLEEHCIGRQEHAEVVAAIRHELREGFKSTHARQDKLMLYLLGERREPPTFRHGDRGPGNEEDGG